MPKTSRQQRAAKVFDYPVRVEVFIPALQPFAALDLLDISRLGTKTRKIEVGFVDGECCKNIVCATVRKGLVTELEVLPCEDTPAPRELLPLLIEARRQVMPDGQLKFQPVSWTDFIKAPAQIFAARMYCVLLCIPGYCIRCCSSTIPAGGGVGEGSTITVCGEARRRTLSTQ